MRLAKCRKVAASFRSKTRQSDHSEQNLDAEYQENNWVLTEMQYKIAIVRRSIITNVFYIQSDYKRKSFAEAYVLCFFFSLAAQSQYTYANTHEAKLTRRLKGNTFSYLSNCLVDKFEQIKSYKKLRRNTFERLDETAISFEGKPT